MWRSMFFLKEKLIDFFHLLLYHKMKLWILLVMIVGGVSKTVLKNTWYRMQINLYNNWPTIKEWKQKTQYAVNEYWLKWLVLTEDDRALIEFIMDAITPS